MYDCCVVVLLLNTILMFIIIPVLLAQVLLMCLLWYGVIVVGLVCCIDGLASRCCGCLGVLLHFACDGRLCWFLNVCFFFMWLLC